VDGRARWRGEHGARGRPRLVVRQGRSERGDGLSTSRHDPPAGRHVGESMQVGSRITPGAPLLTIVPLDQLWVEANFKESELRDIRVGQPATVEADMYGSKVEFHGKVMGLSAGTGSAFSLLPAQNASGNWIKVVQRVPVRIALDPKELAAHPLRVGLSATATIDITKKGEGALGAVIAPPARYATTTPGSCWWPRSSPRNAPISASTK